MNIRLFGFLFWFYSIINMMILSFFKVIGVLLVVRVCLMMILCWIGFSILVDLRNWMKLMVFMFRMLFFWVV